MPYWWKRAWRWTDRHAKIWIIDHPLYRLIPNTIWNNNSQLLELDNRDFLEMGKGMLWGSIFVKVQRTHWGWLMFQELELLPRVLSLLFPVLNILGILEYLHQSWDNYYYDESGSQVLEKESSTKGSSWQVPSLLGNNHPHEFTRGLWAAFAKPHRLAERLCDHELWWILHRRGRPLQILREGRIELQ